MLEVKTPQEALALIQKKFKPLGLTETVRLADALGRVLAEPITAQEYVPDFDRSTVDELVPPDKTPGPGQVRDVNSPLFTAMLTEFGAEAVNYGIVVDDEELLRQTMQTAAGECDAVIISGGSSVGAKDAACRIIEGMGDLLLHGIAIKPGKPTIMGKMGNKPLIGLPGHPVAACFAAQLFVLPLLGRLMGRKRENFTVTAELTESLGANHGREQINACRLHWEDGKLLATPIRFKSGLITQLAGADGYFIISRDCEGLPKGAAVDVFVK